MLRLERMKKFSKESLVQHRLEAETSSLTKRPNLPWNADRAVLTVICGTIVARVHKKVWWCNKDSDKECIFLPWFCSFLQTNPNSYKSTSLVLCPTIWFPILVCIDNKASCALVLLFSKLPLWSNHDLEKHAKVDRNGSSGVQWFILVRGLLCTFQISPVDKSCCHVIFIFTMRFGCWLSYPYGNLVFKLSSTYCINIYVSALLNNHCRLSNITFSSLQSPMIINITIIHLLVRHTGF